jgi:hypothetical protein
VVEVRCHGTDQMRSWGINKAALNGGAWWRVDGTGIQVQPEWTGKNEVLKVTVRCERG